MVTTINGGLAVTAGAEQARVSGVGSTRPEKTEVIDRQTSIPTAASINQTNASSIANKQINDSPTPVIPKDSIRVSSTLGRSDIRTSLTPSRATEIYEKIARLL